MLARRGVRQSAGSSGSGRIGRAALPGTDVAIRGEDGAPVANGGIGEIWVRGPQVMLGYAAPRKETRSVLRDGWLATADLGRLDADGYLYVVDRLKDVIVSSGFKVYPHRVEAALLTHAAIAEAVVVGEADSRAGMVPVAHLTLRAGETVDEAALRIYLGPMLSRHEMPRRFQFHATLPRTRMGKVQRAAWLLALDADQGVATSRAYGRLAREAAPGQPAAKRAREAQAPGAMSAQSVGIGYATIVKDPSRLRRPEPDRLRRGLP